MIETQSLPNSPAGSRRLSQTLEKTAVRSAAATEHVLFDHSPKAHGYVAAGLRNYTWRTGGKTQHFRSATQGNDRNPMELRPLRRRHREFTAKQMDVMP